MKERGKWDGGTGSSEGKWGTEKGQCKKMSVHDLINPV
jgi:hypothetical protein